MWDIDREDTEHTQKKDELIDQIQFKDTYDEYTHNPTHNTHQYTDTKQTAQCSYLAIVQWHFPSLLSLQPIRERFTQQRLSWGGLPRRWQWRRAKNNNSVKRSLSLLYVVTLCGRTDLPWHHRFDSDTWPLPWPLSCVIPHLSPAELHVDLLPNNIEMPWR